MPLLSVSYNRSGFFDFSLLLFDCMKGSEVDNLAQVLVPMG